MNNERKYDVTALGELLIDFTENGLSDQGNPLLEANPGGAPCNVLSMLQKLGRKTAFIGKVGNDGFGNLLQKAIEDQGISSRGLRKDEEVHTTLALVLKKEDGDRDFAFYRKPGADVNINEEEIDEQLIRDSGIFHYGSLSLTDEPARSATVKALKLAKEAGCILTYDPNLREPLWPDLEVARQQISYGMKFADAVKISDNEILWLTECEDYEEAVKCLRKQYPNLKLVCLTLGAHGSRAYWKNIRVTQDGFINENTVDTTGAGDTFCGCMIDTILQYGLEDLDEEKLQKMLIKGNGAASLVTTRKGALRSMPSLEEIDQFLKERGY